MISIQIENYSLGLYNEHQKNIFYESLLWLIFKQTKKLMVGKFLLKVVPNVNTKGIFNVLLISNILPEVENKVTIKYKEKKFIILVEQIVSSIIAQSTCYEQAFVSCSCNVFSPAVG